MKRFSIISRATAWLLLGAVGLVTVSPLMWRPETRAPVDVERFLGFALIGAAFGFAYPRHRLLVAGLTIGAAGAFEGLQHLVADRDPALADFLVKAAGSATGAFSVAWIEGARRKAP